MRACASEVASALSVVVAIQHVPDADDPIAEFGEIAGGRLDRGMTEPSLDLLDRHTFASERRGVVAAQRVRVREAVRYPSNRGMAAHELREALLGDRAGRPAARARERHEQDVVVA
jgi:hypothetical protein